MKKNIVKTTGVAFLSGLLAVGTFTSCSEDLLEVPQKGVVAEGDYYITDADAQAALIAAYDHFAQDITGFNDGATYCPFRFVFNLCSDDIYAAGEFFGDNDFAGEMNEFRYDSGSAVITNSYNRMCMAAYYASTVVNYFGGEKANTPVKKQCVAEARVLRAYIQMMLTIGWGNPPMLDHVYKPGEYPTNCADHNAALEWCAQECLDAVKDLPERDGKNDKNGAAVVTQGFAYAVAGKAYLFAGKNADAASALKKVIDSENYDLVPGERYGENFHIEGDLNEEKIFEPNIEACALDTWNGYIQKSTWMEANIWNWRSDHFVLNPSSMYSSIDGWGGLGVPQWIADEFVAHDGADSYRLKATIININDVVFKSKYQPIEVVEGDELQSYGTPAKNEDGTNKTDKSGKQLYTVDLSTVPEDALKTSDDLGIGEKGLYGQSFYLALKPVAKSTDLRSPGDNLRLNNFTIMRYAEVLLMYAEAALANGQTTEALNAVNQIRTRAGIAPLASVTLEDIKAEKKIELWLEGNRWADLVRWKDFDGVKNAGQHVSQLYDKLLRAPKAGENPTWENGSEANSRFYLVDSHVAKDNGANIGFKEGKHELFPFPTNTVSVNPNIKQNPNW